MRSTADPQQHGSGAGPETKRKELRFAVVRHAERADTSFDTEWPFSDDAKTYPYDPPITPLGRQQAKDCGQRLLQLSGPGDTTASWRTAITSPYFRCVETAVEICKATGASLMIDEGWGEVRFSEFFEKERSTGQTRTMQFLASYVLQKGIKLHNVDAPRGKIRDDLRPETTAQARERYASKFMEYLDKALLSQSSFIVVTHGDSLPSCLSLFHAYRQAEVLSVPFCGMLVGRLEQPLPVSKLLEFKQTLAGARSTSNACGKSGSLDGLCLIETTCKLEGYPEGHLAPESSTLPSTFTRPPKSRFHSSFILRRAQSFANTDNSTCATFQDMRQLKKQAAPAGLPPLDESPSPRPERAVESDTEDDVGEDFGFLAIDPKVLELGLVRKPEALTAVTSSTAISTQIDSVGESAKETCESDVNSSSCEYDYSVEAAIDVVSTGSAGACWTSEMAGLLTDPTFKKMPSCRGASRPKTKGQLTCSPMSCLRIGPFARMPSSPDSRRLSISSKGSESAGSIGPIPGPILPVPFLQDPKDVKFTAITGLGNARQRLKFPDSDSSLDLSSIEANSLWERRQLRRPPPLPI
jgi:broad specificity phosphatase PhoE